MPSQTLSNIYQCLINPYLNYGINVWGRASKIHLNKILAPTLSLFISLINVLPVKMIYFKSVCNLMYDVANNTCPSAISDYFVRSRNIHTHNTRHNTSNNFYIEHSKLNKLNASFVRSGVKIWNNIPKSVREVGKNTLIKCCINLC